MAIAVSGGADSMALLLLAHEWAQKKSIRIVALTVDHGLRKESKKEAAQVSAWCKEYKIEHHTLKWKAPKLKKSIQESARDARYKLLTDWCKKNRVKNLLTAHHRGDQAETLFFRLARGSNLRGLACIAPESELNGVRLIRPLLAIGKKDLIAYLQNREQAWIEDPTNQNLKYTRNSIRAQLQGREDIEIRAANIALFFSRFRSSIDKKTDAAFSRTVKLSAKNNSVDAKKFAALPPEIAMLVLAKTIQQLTGGNHPPRTEKLSRLCSWLQAPDSRKKSLSHVEFEHLPEKGIFKLLKSAK